jgi:hypothetical protein
LYNSLKTRYYVGETFKSIDLLVGHADSTVTFDKATYQDIIGFDTSKIGKYVIQIAYRGFLIDVPIEVYLQNFEVIDEIVILESTPTEYLVGDEFKGGKIIVFADDGHIDINVEEWMLTGFSTDKIGMFPVTIEYAGLYAQMTIVVRNPITNISNYEPIQTYEQNAEYIPHKLKLERAVGDYELIDLEITMLNGFDTSTTGVKTVTIMYKGFVTSYEITVVEPAPEQDPNLI